MCVQKGGERDEGIKGRVNQEGTNREMGRRGRVCDSESDGDFRSGEKTG